MKKARCPIRIAYGDPEDCINHSCPYVKEGKCDYPHCVDTGGDKRTEIDVILAQNIPNN